MIYIIGKNSKLLKTFKSYLSNSEQDKLDKFIILSHRDISSLPQGSSNDVCILFSYSKTIKENELLLKNLLKIFEEIRIIGSSSIHSEVSEHFFYSRIKKRQFEYAKKLYRKKYNVFCHCFGEFNESGRLGAKCRSSFQDLSEYIFNEKISIFSRNIYVIKGKNSETFSNFYDSLEKMIGVKITAFFIKLLTNNTYGYTRIR